MKRFDDLDFVKGVMIMIMVCFHINVGLLRNLTPFVYSFHMPVFLIFSGYLLSTSTDTTTWLNKLLRGLVIPYIIFEMIYIWTIFFAGKLGVNFSNKIGELDFRSTMTFIFLKPIGSFWFFHTLIICNVLVYFLEKIKAVEHLTKVIAFLGCTLLFSYYVIPGLHFANTVFFIIGYFFKKYEVDIPKSLIAIVAVIVLFFLGDNNRGSISSVATTIFVIAFLMACCNIAPSSKLNRLVYFIGRNTLIVVLLHPIFLNLVKLTQKYFYMLDSTLVVYSIFNTVLTVGLCIFSAFVLDLIGLSKIIFGKKIYAKF